MRKVTLTLVLGGIVAGLTASPAAAGAEPKQFCKAAAVLEVTDNPSPKQLRKLRDTAPDDIADTADAVVTALEEQGEEVFGDPTFEANFAALDASIVDACGYTSYDVSMQDFSFTGVPSEVAKGKVAFVLTNAGIELHEISVYRLKGDNTLDDVLAAPDEQAARKLVTQVKGGGFTFPGGGDTALFDLKKPGEYVALCSIPVGTVPDAPGPFAEPGDGPPHHAQGMAVQFTVA